MKFLADENVDVPAVKALKKLGVDIVSVQELDKISQPDEGILDFCKENKRAIVTSDSDYLRLHAKGARHAGIVYLTKPLDTSRLIREIQKVSLMFESIEDGIVFMPMKV